MTAPAQRARALRALALALAWLLLLTSGACREARRARGEEVWRFAIEETRGSVQDAYAQRFKQLVEQKSGGSVRVIVYRYGTLGTSDHLLEQLHTGTLQLAMSSPGHLGKLIPGVQVFLLHFVLGESDEVIACALADRPLLAQLDALYSEKGLRFLAAFSEGFMAWTAHKPLRTPADFAGLRFRIMTSPLLVAAYEAYGARPTPLPYSEVYSALQLRMIDGQVNPVFSIQEMSFYEVSSALTLANHASFVTTVAANPRFVERLAPTRQALLTEVVETLNGYIHETQRSMNEERLRMIREAKPSLEVLTLTREQRARFRQAAAPVQAQFLALAGDRGQALLDTLQGAVDRCSQ